MAPKPGRGVFGSEDRNDAGGPLGPKKSGATVATPMRPPERLSHPSTLSLKYGVHTRRLEVIPPCECPASQKALMFSRPIASITDDTMFCK